MRASAALLGEFVDPVSPLRVCGLLVLFAVHEDKHTTIAVTMAREPGILTKRYRSARSAELNASDLLAHFHNILQVFISLREDRTGTRRSIHFTDVTFADHRIEYRGGTTVADAKMSLEQRC